jgi:glycosyltransferase involved in cell wall biosynthesis
MKILYVATISRTVHAFLVPHIEMLVRDGHRVDVACNMVTDEDDRLLKLGCRYFNLPFQRSPLSGKNISAYRALKKLVKSEHYDLVHTHTPVASACVRLACSRIPGVKVYYTAHGFHFYKGAPFFNWLVYYQTERWLSRFTDVLITINDEDYARARDSFNAKKVVLIPGVGIDTDRISNIRIDKTAKRADLGIPAADTVILSVGELNVNKNHRTVIRALARLRDNDLTYVICGRGAEATRLIRLINRRKLSDKVRLLGFRPDVLEIIQIADLYVLPSFREGLSVSLMEGIAAGLPCVVSDIRGNRDLIQSGKGGLLCPPGDVGAFASAIATIISDRTAAGRMGRWNRESVNRYSLASVLPQISELYREGSDMKILYVSTIASTINAFLVPHIEMLVRKGHQVDVACNGADALDARLSDLGCRLFDFSFQRSPLNKRNIPAYKNLKKLIVDGHYNLVHTHTPVASALVRLACRKLSTVKVFYTAHGFYFYTGAPLTHWLLYYSIERLLSRYTDLLITINQEDYARAAKSLKAKKVVYVPGVGINIGKMNSTRIDVKAKRAELGIPENAAVVLSVGELNVKKNHATVIQSIARMENNNLIYLICGKGEEESRLSELIHRHDLADKVKLLGHRSDVFEMYQITDVLVHPSFREGLPVALMEAMAAGLPCVVSDIRGNIDLIEDGKGGIVCRPDDIDGFASAIHTVLADKQAASAMGSFNKESIKQFDIGAVLNKMMEIYDAEGC